MIRTTVTVLERMTDDRVALTAHRVYDAECVLHTARQSHIDEWILAASDRLHDALVDYLAAVRAAENHGMRAAS
jgi:hypothetical protein